MIIVSLFESTLLLFKCTPTVLLRLLHSRYDSINERMALHGRVSGECDKQVAVVGHLARTPGRVVVAMHPRAVTSGLTVIRVVYEPLNNRFTVFCN